ncbi:MAG TPA: transglutaminase [Alphaproteobacteria bacterium]|nr:transglutaminase [Alphaproteobacteria bacterium]
MTRYQVRHKTVYRYLYPVPDSLHLLHLRPRETPQQAVAKATIKVSPEPAAWLRRDDAFGNAIDWISLADQHETLIVEAAAEVARDAGGSTGAGQNTSHGWEQVRERLRDGRADGAAEAIPYLFDSPMISFQSDLAAYALESFTPKRRVAEAAVDLMRRIHKDFRYVTGVTDVSTPVDKVFALRAGVCQDLAHVGVAAVRAIGLAARYVSGYLLTFPPPGQEKLLGADASHAWFSVWCPEAGWIDLDPTNDLVPKDQHITLAWGRDYSDVAPITGMIVGGGDHVIEVGVDVVPM